ncbi:MAG TPA: hypothetical protein VK514_06965, partial [Candidatus Acidoferrum sp.]|nr:hypothetical protein [Candidatus Acidoferrum sp.]
VGDEMVGQFVFGVQYPQQLFLLDYQQRRLRRGGVCAASGRPCSLSPKKSPGPNIATTASLPEPLTTDNRTPPFCTYITVSAESP